MSAARIAELEEQLRQRTGERDHEQYWRSRAEEKFDAMVKADVDPAKQRDEALTRLVSLERETRVLREALERDRSMVCDQVNLIRQAIECYSWLRNGSRGSYAYDDERYVKEFGDAVECIEAALKPLSRIASDWTNCPTDPDDIKRARAALAGESAPTRDAEIEPDCIYDLNDPDVSFAWDERFCVDAEVSIPAGEIRPFGTFRYGPNWYATRVILSRDENGDPDETEIQWFRTEAEAQAALTPSTGESDPDAHAGEVDHG